MKTLVIGIASKEEIKERTLAIARGSLKPKKTDPKIWFSSIESFAQILSTKNRMLLEIIKTNNPKSLTELSVMAGRQKSNLSRTLKSMQQYGLVDLKPAEKTKELIPTVKYDHLKLDYGLLKVNQGLNLTKSIT